MIYDLSVYGHLTTDHIFTDFEETISLGAMVNVWDAIVKTDNSLSINLNPTAIGTAIILVDREQGTRVGRGHLNLKTNKPDVQESKWHHIMYLNQLEDLSFIDEIKTGIVSADVTSGKMDIEPYLDKIDYLFISDEDLFMDVEELAKKVKGYVVLHYPSGSYVTDGKTSFKTKVDIVSGLNVLGAGDIFAASFILRHTTTNDTLEEIVNYAHSRTKELLLEKNK